MSEVAHLFLVGFMGAGKSTVGRLIAERTGRDFVDLDAFIEERSGRAVREIFADSGEEEFRELESVALETVVAEPPAVIACGGGIILRAENRALLKGHGRVVYLKVSAGEALARIGDVSSRPLLAGPSGEMAATTLLAARESLYRSVADVVIDTEGLSAEQVAVAAMVALDGGEAL